MPKTYGLSNDGGEHWYSHSYSSYGGNVAQMGNWGTWTKQPARWKTPEGAEGFKAKHDWLAKHQVLPLPYTAQEKRDILCNAAPDLLAACKAVYSDPYTTCACADKLRAAIAKAEGE